MKALLKNNHKQRISFLMIILFVLCFLAGRAALSIISVAILFLFIWNDSNRIIIKKLLIAGLCIILPVLVSGSWSDDKSIWWQSFINKIPLITIGVGFLSVDPDQKQLKQIIYLLTGVVLIGCFWSVITFLNDKEAITKSYLVAKVMPTILDDDHIRFSWLIALSLILLNWQLIIRSNKIEKIIGGMISVLLISFLHLLASKTGLLCLYASIIVMIFYFLFAKGMRKISLILFAAILTILFVAYQSFPTLHNRVQYVLYDFGNYSKGKIETGSSDGARVLSLKAGWYITLRHPLAGVGFGDLKNEVNQWHVQFHPNTLDYERFIPTNEWLIYAAASGWLGMILFSVGMALLIPFFSLNNIFSVCLMMSLFIPLITDDSLEGQYGVAIFSLVICLGYYLKKQVEPQSQKRQKDSLKNKSLFSSQV